MSTLELIARWERQYMEFLNACKASTGNDADYWRWNGHAARLRECLEDLHKAYGITPVPSYGSKQWRAANGVGL